MKANIYIEEIIFNSAKFTVIERPNETEEKTNKRAYEFLMRVVGNNAGSIWLAQQG